MKITQKTKLNKADYKKKRDEILRILKADVGGFSPVESTPAARKARLERCQDDHFAFYSTYLPHYFSKPPAAFHIETDELISRRGGGVVPVVEAAPRGFAKTTLVSFGYVIHQSMFKLRHFVILGSDTNDLASDNTAYIHLELANNRRLMDDFNDGAPLVDANAAVDDFVTTTDTRILARGRGQRVRGFKHGAFRPDLVILDDLENDKNVKNPRLVKECLAWIREAVYPAIDEENGSLFIVGTILAKKSALAIMIAGKDEPYDRWVRRKYKALNEDRRGGLVSLWPERHPVESLLVQKRNMGSLAFNKEKQNDPVDEEGAFREEWILAHAFTPDDCPPGFRAVGFFDPSISTKQSADFRAIVVVAQNQAGELLVPGCYMRRESLEAVLRQAWALNAKWRFTGFGVEDNLFQALLLPEFDRLGREMGFLPVRGVTHKTTKEARINRLSPLVERGILRFLAPQYWDDDYRELIEQLIAFPNGQHDDGPDALEGAVQMLHYGARPGFLVG